MEQELLQRPEHSVTHLRQLLLPVFYAGEIIHIEIIPGGAAADEIARPEFLNVAHYCGELLGNIEGPVTTDKSCRLIQLKFQDS